MNGGSCLHVSGVEIEVLHQWRIEGKERKSCMGRGDQPMWIDKEKKHQRKTQAPPMEANRMSQARKI